MIITFITMVMVIRDEGVASERDEGVASGFCRLTMGLHIM